MSGKSKSSRRWLREHFDDPYVKRSHQEGLRSRAAFKLEEIHKKDHIFRPGMTIVDLGAAPGGWLEMAARFTKGQCRLIGLDLLPIAPIENVVTIEGDFREPGPLQELLVALADSKVDLVMSDMAPNISGMGAVDQPRAMYLAELALDFAQEHLELGGDFLVKLFHGEGFDAFLSSLRRDFKSVKMRKPGASRPRSREVYALARGLRSRER